MAVCYFCGNDFPEDYKVYKSSECPSCGKDVKVCRNCRFYSIGAKWDCRETISEAVIDKEHANFCEYFKIGNTTGGKLKDKADNARSAFDNLFGNE
jgi:predicted RNA-binding Zn-ribbon protein involved in translation (DUF1610 family)